MRAGAPELRPDSQYNQDIAYYVDHFSQSVDVYVVLVRSDADKCNSPHHLNLLEELQWRLEQFESVQNLGQDLRSNFPCLKHSTVESFHLSDLWFHAKCAQKFKNRNDVSMFRELGECKVYISHIKNMLNRTLSMSTY